MDDRHEDRYLGKILFKHYKLKKKIGEGSFGKIYIAIHIETKEEYAIKLVSKKFFNIKNIKLLIIKIVISNNLILLLLLFKLKSKKNIGKKGFK